MKALLRFLLGDPPGQAADGGAIGIGLSAALRKHYSADDADRYLREWSTRQEREVRERH
ncbi:unnamed protein product [[Actinomadura] parvosata subsp. kistnae]|uniref:Uncharacterized protein n=1 Tax=Nonomuraea composti TaxID=2720023 RepID=A0ABX1B4U0_9ACTN|nr:MULTISPECIES: hypothetical protein [unclassified Nonomuraea]NJP89998.1 hypothetical protein [Nonomuraea sp. FMUSA5-5]SPL96970.1 unnamed protein product [Actinomadura parvosata subsp. kistnae]